MGRGDEQRGRGYEAGGEGVGREANAAKSLWRVWCEQETRRERSSKICDEYGADRRDSAAIRRGGKEGRRERQRPKEWRVEK